MHVCEYVCICCEVRNGIVIKDKETYLEMGTKEDKGINKP